MGFMTSSYAQFESNKKFKAIPPSNTSPKPEKKTIPPPTTDFPVIIPPNVYKSPDIIKSPPNPVSSYQIGKPSEISMIPKNNGFINPGDEIRDKLNKDMDRTLIREGLKEDSRYLVKIDVNFGNIKTKSEYFLIRCRDFGAIDGDLIKATLNSDIIRGGLELQNDYQEFRIYFKEGINIFELEALNKGLLGGNTGEFQFYDAEGKFIRSDYWENWDAGVKGKFVIIKE
ncbi:hypothetical protein FNW52_05720 [Flavobacterium sp. ZT3R18]|nr:hypothetical protein FNW52_05720 [Flavobacterium sp. ZT3R18]